MATVTLYEFTYHTTDDSDPAGNHIKITETGGEGPFYCTASRCVDSQWCRHMEAMIKTNLDAGQVAVLDNDFMSVPISPVNGLWMTCHVEPLHKSGMKSIAVVMPHVTANPVLTSEYVVVAGPDGTARTAVDLGVIAEGEGRKAVRTMLIEHLVGWYPAVGPCSTTYHDNMRSPVLPSYERLEAMTLKSNYWRAMWDAYSIIFNGMCLDCYRLADPEQDIPEV